MSIPIPESTPREDPNSKMDNQLPEQNQDQLKAGSPPENILNQSKGILVRNKLIVAVALVLAIFLAASFLYIKINKSNQPINKPIPKTQQGKPASQNTQFPPPTEFQKGSLICPSVSKFCLQGKDIYIGPRYIGFGGEIKAKDPIFASFDGELTTSRITIAQSLSGGKTQDIFFSLLTDKSHLLNAAYYFSGQPSKDRAVTKGEVIATSSGEPMPVYGNSSLLFVLTRNDKIKGPTLNGEKLHLTKDSFK